jgi:hypothetical protein
MTVSKLEKKLCKFVLHSHSNIILKISYPFEEKKKKHLKIEGVKFCLIFLLVMYLQITLCLKVESFVIIMHQYEVLLRNIGTPWNIIVLQLGHEENFGVELYNICNLELKVCSLKRVKYMITMLEVFLTYFTITLTFLRIRKHRGGCSTILTIVHSLMNLLKEK